MEKEGNNFNVGFPHQSIIILILLFIAARPILAIIQRDVELLEILEILPGILEIVCILNFEANEAKCLQDWTVCCQRFKM